jgi:hypothetical protein
MSATGRNLIFRYQVFSVMRSGRTRGLQMHIDRKDGKGQGFELGRRSCDLLQLTSFFISLPSLLPHTPSTHGSLTKYESLEQFSYPIHDSHGKAIYYVALALRGLSPPRGHAAAPPSCSSSPPARPNSLSFLSVLSFVSSFVSSQFCQQRQTDRYSPRLILHHNRPCTAVQSLQGFERSETHSSSLFAPLG